jgi:hypothetical protein
VLYNFVRHLNAYHQTITDLGDDHVESESSDVFSEDQQLLGDFDPAISTSHLNVLPPSDFLQDVRREGVTLVARLRANSSIPYGVIPEIVQSYNEMAGSLSSYIQAEVRSSLLSTGIDSIIIDQVSQEIEHKLQACRSPLDFLSTRYRIDSHFAGHSLMVAPQSVYYVPRLESHGGTSTFVYDQFQYVSVTKTILSLLQNKSYVDALLQNKCRPGVLRDFVDGSRFREHYLFSDCSKFSLMLQLFYDGLGVTNPLRSQGSAHNVGVFYYTIKNLPQAYTSCFGNVHLLALGYAHDIAIYGYRPILDKFVEEMKQLSTVGLDGVFPCLGSSTVYASLCQVTCDNLALNGLLGFVESFSASHFCTICYATKDDIQTKFDDALFEKRTVDQYNNDLANLAQSRLKQSNNESGKSKVHYRGVKNECRLNEIKGYHVTDNWCLDIMHTLLEGVVLVELGCILHGLCMLDKCLTLPDMNTAMCLLWGKITVEKTHKPVEITRIQEPGHVLAPSMKAVQCWALLKYLPLAVGKHIPLRNKHWKFLLHLSHLVDLIFAQCFTLEMTVYLKHVISDHLSMFVKLYSSAEVRLRPKHHFLVHLPTIIVKSGPLVGMSCMRYELKNSFFKRCAHIVCNFTNICYTLAHRHQQQALESQLCNKHIRSVVTVGKHSLESVQSLPYHDALFRRFCLKESEEVAVSSTLCVATVAYKQGQLVMLDIDMETGLPRFGKIVSFVSCVKNGEEHGQCGRKENDEWHFIVESMKTDNFTFHLHAYEVIFFEQPLFEIFRLSDLTDYHPLYCHSLLAGSTKKHFVRLPYHIF